MGRKLEFDKDKALARATELFWRDGYMNTSLKKLLIAMNMGESSFYHTFKGKKSLYLECINHYNQGPMKKRVAAICSNRSAKNRIYDFFEIVISDFKENKTTGCLVSNSLSQEILMDEALKQKIYSVIDSLLEHFGRIVEEGVANGEFNKKDPTVTAKVLLTYLHGLMRLSAYRFDPEKQKIETHTFLDSILL